MKNVKLYGALLVFVVGTCALASCTSVKSEEQKYIRELNNSKTNQEVFIQTTDDETLNQDRFIESLSNEIELVLATETGNTVLKHSKDNEQWNSWIVGSDVELNIDYKATVSINSNAIKLVKSNDHIVATYSPNDIKVNTVEITSKSILDNSKWLSEGYSNDELIALERIAISQVKSQIEDDVNVTYASEQSLQTYIKELGEVFNITVKFIN